MGPDFRVLLAKARKSEQKYKRIYNEYPSTGILVKEVASVMQEFTQSYDETTGPALYQVDPSGSYWAWKASAIGKNMINAKTFLEKRYNDDIELEDAVHTSILTLKEGFEGQMTENSIEIGRKRIRKRVRGDGRNSRLLDIRRLRKIISDIVDNDIDQTQGEKH
ncbi:371_t:CDS:2 [Scutellospora calospora]|uniref:371_t:CDS:1 n=1 Tax=Scutellospora calospora TaxID=85575 RepID=A0ACA9JU67_9GLOM|nr:371_t:CDS:2 [Scutellospora calospora]